MSMYGEIRKQRLYDYIKRVKNEDYNEASMQFLIDLSDMFKHFVADASDYYNIEAVDEW